MGDNSFPFNTAIICSSMGPDEIVFVARLKNRRFFSFEQWVETLIRENKLGRIRNVKHH